MGKKKQVQQAKLNPNDSKLNLLIILVLIVGFISAIGLFASQDTQECSVNYEISLDEKDLNKLIELEYQGGFCERMGLESNILVQDLNGIPYGVPICVAGDN